MHSDTLQFWGRPPFAITTRDDAHRRKRHSNYQGLSPCERVRRTLEERLERQQHLRNTE